jgi:hypothetical protein
MRYPVKTPEGETLQTTFMSAVPVLPATNMDQAFVFYEQLGFQVIHWQADYALVIREAVELHIWLCRSALSRKILGVVSL